MICLNNFCILHNDMGADFFRKFFVITTFSKIVKRDFRHVRIDISNLNGRGKNLLSDDQKFWGWWWGSQQGQI